MLTDVDGDELSDVQCSSAVSNLLHHEQRDVLPAVEDGGDKTTEEKPLSTPWRLKRQKLNQMQTIPFYLLFSKFVSLTVHSWPKLHFSQKKILLSFSFFYHF